MAELREISFQECERLLRGGVVGRVAVATADGPHIVPINYSWYKNSLVFRTTPYSVLGSYGRNTVLAFEIDHFDYDRQRGWSVLARGRADAINDPDLIEEIRRIWPPRPWADGTRNVFFRLRYTELTGRRLGNGWDPHEDLPVQCLVRRP